MQSSLLAGARAVITGGSRGIGADIVRTFLKNGAEVHYFSRSPGDSTDEFAELAREHDTSVRHHPVDVADETAVDAAVKEVLDEGPLDVLVNNAGVTRDGLVMRMKLEDWDAVMNVNLRSAFLCSRAVSRAMIRQRKGSIINITSIVGVIGNGGQANYASSKAGLIGLTKSLARELASRSVRVNAIAPGFIQTDMTGQLNDEQRSTLTAQIPLDRLGTGEDVARAALFLASDLSTYVTGHVLHVTGGLGM